MIGVWASSPTYNHGFLVLPLAAALTYLGWRQGEGFAPWPLAMLGLAAAAMIYGASIWLDAQLLAHSAAVGGLMSAIALCVGPTALLRHRFAFLFLLFMVPVGEGLVPALQSITAVGIMVMTDLFGLPAIRDGLLIRTDVGDFNVAKACAGLRFLVASGVTGALFAHLFFTDWRKQVGFVIAALIIPVLANIARAGGTVIVASLTNMQVAAGVDHLLYGWVFFFAVLAVLLGVGVRFADPAAPARPTPQMVQGAAVPVFWVLIGIVMIALPRGI